jgi:hypothetical protein
MKLHISFSIIQLISLTSSLLFKWYVVIEYTEFNYDDFGRYIF